MARTSNDDIPDLIHILTVASSVEMAAGGTCTEQQVRARLADDEVFIDWEDSPGVTKPTARRVRAELIAERKASFLAGIVANAEVDRQKRQAERERAEAGRLAHERAIVGTRVNAPGATPAPWAEDDE
jgi:hypothetical protein